MIAESRMKHGLTTKQSVTHGFDALNRPSTVPFTDLGMQHQAKVPSTV